MCSRIFKLLPVFSLLLFISAGTWAQILPVDAATGKVYYAEEVLVKDGPQLELYHRAKAWFAKAGKLSEGLQVDDLANGVIIGKNNLPFQIKKEARTQSYQLRYTLKIEMEDDRYWYSFTDFKLQNLTEVNSSTKEQKKPAWYPLEVYLTPDKSKSLNNKRLQDAVHKQILALIQEIKKSMD